MLSTWHFFTKIKTVQTADIVLLCAEPSMFKLTGKRLGMFFLLRPLDALQVSFFSFDIRRDVNSQWFGGYFEKCSALRRCDRFGWLWWLLFAKLTPIFIQLPRYGFFWLQSIGDKPSSKSRLHSFPSETVRMLHPIFLQLWYKHPRVFLRIAFGLLGDVKAV